jgi:hypothetical protein
MSGALIDLVSTGVQDTYITGNPEVSFFRQNYKRYTNFAMKPILLNPVGFSASAGNQCSITIPNKGDLLSYIWLDLGASGTIGATGIEADASNPAIFEFYIGGQLIDRQDATYMTYLWNKFLVDSSPKAAAIYNSTASNTKTNLHNSTILPLHFFFCDHGYLPLVALQYHQVEIRIKFSSSSAPPSDMKIYANFIHLDTSERNAVVEKNHEILIEQVQSISFDGSSTSPKFDLSLLNHPVKCLMWADVTSDTLSTNNVQLYLNGTQVFESEMSDRYFSMVQPYYHSEFASDLMQGGSGSMSGYSAKMYSFALKVGKHQPSGTCNFSRMDTASLSMGSVSGVTTAAAFKLWAVNYNILRIRNGLGGLAFAN